jgi:Transposase IS66 family
MIRYDPFSEVPPYMNRTWLHGVISLCSQMGSGPTLGARRVHGRTKHELYRRAGSETSRHQSAHLRATEGALWGSVRAHGFLPDTVIVSDDAGQFNVGQHGLCWVHSERLVHKLDAFTAENRAAQATVRDLIWQFYADLKAYRCHPTKRRKTALRARFDRIFTRMTGFVTLDRLLMRLNANKPELLMVLDRPETPLHTNGSENDIRCHVTRRKVSGGTRSDVGRDCRDAFLGLAKTCAKLEIAFWDYLGARLAVPGSRVIPCCPKSSSPEPACPDRHDFCPSLAGARVKFGYPAKPIAACKMARNGRLISFVRSAALPFQGSVKAPNQS